MLYLILYGEFFRIGLCCVGGGYAAMPFIQEVVVYQHHWLTLRQFVDIFTISQMTPGPIGINAATFVGTKISGLGGALAATLGFVSPSLLLGILLARLLQKYGAFDPIRGILNGLRPAVIALILLAGLSFFCLTLWQSDSLPTHLSMPHMGHLCILCLSWIGLRKKMSIIIVLLLSGLLGLLTGVPALFS